MWMFPKIQGKNRPKMDGENFMENPMNKWMIWVVKTHYFWRATHVGWSKTCGSGKSAWNNSTKQWVSVMPREAFAMVITLFSLGNKSQVPRLISYIHLPAILYTPYLFILVKLPKIQRFPYDFEGLESMFETSPPQQKEVSGVIGTCTIS